MQKVKINICDFLSPGVSSLNPSRYEAVFYGALALVLVAWILFENTILHLMMVKKLSASMKRTGEITMLENDVRYLQLSDVRIPLIFVSLIPFHLDFLFQISSITGIDMVNKLEVCILIHAICMTYISYMLMVVILNLYNSSNYVY